MDHKLKKFTLQDRIRSFGNAFRGLWVMLKNEHNFKIQIFILFLVIIAGLLFKITIPEWMAVALVSALVLSAECFNSALEDLWDTVSKENDPVIQRSKDIAAAGVLVSALISIIVGFLIFIPRILSLFQGK